MATFRIEYELPGLEYAKGTVLVTDFENRQLSEVEQFLNFAKNPEQTAMTDLQNAWKTRKILKVEVVRR